MKRPGTTVKKAGTLPDALRATVSPQMRAALLNQPLAFTLVLTNKGATTAHGCFIHPYDTNLHVIWRQFNPSNGAPIGAFNAPTNIAAGASQTFAVVPAKSAPVFAYLPSNT